ncbi:MAG TPA: 4-hydroxy-3-methylbut-2-enyl diphosphate reductase [Desulfobulbus sp.]|nr:4-hydroxy-3-methylbut-2-enyl diphosphate reductase [Desulfobulbus sp.]
MEIILAKPRGFCAGVNRAIAIVNEALRRYGAPVYVLHEIVHNTYVVNSLADKGAVFVRSLDDIPTGSVTIFSAHGVSRAVEEQARSLGLHVIDATCPLVTRVHRRVARLNKIGYDVLIIGHRRHPEVEGTCGRAVGRVHVISNGDDVAELRVADRNRVGYVTQTTLSMDDAALLIGLLKEKFPEIDIPDRTDICYATQNRQTAVRELAGRVDLFLVVGSRNSSNSNRLREVAAKQGVRAYLIDSREEIDPAWLEGVRRVGITAGASAPEVLVEEVVDWLKKRQPSTVREMDGPVENTRFKLPELPDFALQET